MDYVVVFLVTVAGTLLAGVILDYMTDGKIRKQTWAQSIWQWMKQELDKSTKTQESYSLDPRDVMPGVGELADDVVNSRNDKSRMLIQGIEEIAAGAEELGAAAKEPAEEKKPELKEKQSKILEYIGGMNVPITEYSVSAKYCGGRMEETNHHLGVLYKQGYIKKVDSGWRPTEKGRELLFGGG